MCSICDGVEAARVCEGTGKYAFDLRTRTEFEYCGKLRMDPALDFAGCSRRVCGLFQKKSKGFIDHDRNQVIVGLTSRHLRRASPP